MSTESGACGIVCTRIHRARVGMEFEFERVIAECTILIGPEHEERVREWLTDAVYKDGVCSRFCVHDGVTILLYGSTLQTLQRRRPGSTIVAVLQVSLCDLLAMEDVCDAEEDSVEGAAWLAFVTRTTKVVDEWFTDKDRLLLPYSMHTAWTLAMSELQASTCGVGEWLPTPYAAGSACRSDPMILYVIYDDKIVA